MAMWRTAARSGEWAQHFSNASCVFQQYSFAFEPNLSIFGQSGKKMDE